MDFYISVARFRGINGIINVLQKKMHVALLKVPLILLPSTQDYKANISPLYPLWLIGNSCTIYVCCFLVIDFATLKC